MKKLLILLTACGTLSALAETIYLKSGSVLKGTVSAVSTSEVTFDAEDFGEVKIKTANIVKLENAGEHVVQFNDNSTETKKLAVADGAYLADGDALALDNVKAIDPGVETWHGSVNVAFTATRGNTYDNTGTVLANLNRRWEKDRVNFNFGYYYSQSGQTGKEKSTTQNRWEVEGQEDHFWTTAYYSYLTLKYERDVIAGLDSRYRVGLGLGYQWLDGYVHEATGKWSFNQEAGANWVRESYRSDSTDKGGFCALRYAHHLKYNPKWNEGVECFHNLEVLPQVDDWEKFLAKTDIGFTTKLIYDFDLLAKIEWNFNSEPPKARRKGDIRYIVGLGYKW